MNDLQRCSSFSALYDASYKVCRNVRWKDSTTHFEESRIETILRTEDDLRNNEYKQRLFSCFSIIERGKPRDIRACHIDDRLVQNALCEQVLIPDWTPRFIYDNSATLQGKGIDFALNRAKIHFQKALHEYKGDFYVLRIDIRKYFDSIDHEALKRDAKELIKDPDIYSLVSYLIDTFDYKVTKDPEPIRDKDYYITRGQEYILVHPDSFQKNRLYYEKGPISLGLGSQTSQLFALLALNKLDHYIKEQLHIKYYGRYMDDLYLMHNKKEYLMYCEDKIESHLRTQGLQLNKKKTTISLIHPIGDDRKRKQPFKFLKWNFYITESGHIIQLPFKEKLAKERRKLRKLAILWQEGKIPTADVVEHYRGWKVTIEKGDTFYILQKMDNYFRSLFKGVEI